MPAKAGIQESRGGYCGASPLDARFRGHDGGDGFRMSVALQGATEGRRRRVDLSGLLFAGFALFLVVLIVLPMAWLVVFAFTDATGAITLANFVTMVTDPDLVDP